MHPHPGRAAIYARYSSEHQNERSIDDQLRLCREFIAGGGGTVAGIYADYAMSGAHLLSRPEAIRMLSDARAGKFDTLVSEALDRLSRDQEHIARIYKELEFLGIRIVTVGEGEISPLHIGLKGTMNAIFLSDLAKKVRRGQSARAAQGAIAGGLSYGYDVVRELDARGEMIRGKRVINEAQAEIVRRIFREYNSGRSPRAIASDLNAEGRPSPAGREWSAVTINGNRKRRSGFLFNELYIGVVVYNRSRFIKDPATGRRVSRLNPEAEWIVTEVPELRIVDPETWAAAQARKQAYAGKPVHKRTRPRHLFSGLMRCGICGGPFTVMSRDRIGCVARRERGTCTNRLSVRGAEVESRVLEGLAAKLLSPERVMKALHAYHDERRRLAKEAATLDGAKRKRLGEIERQIGNIVEMIAQGIASKAVADKLGALEGERDQLMREMQSAGEPSEIVALHPNAPRAFGERVARLARAVHEGGADREEAAEAIRGLVRAVVIHPGANGGAPEIRLLGDLAAALSLAATGTDVPNDCRDGCGGRI